jgi:hypothetical protein
MANFDFTPEYNYYKKKPEGVYSLLESDWNRLKNLVDKIVPEEGIFSRLASICEGIFVSSIFFLFSLTTITKSSIENWIYIVSWSALATSFLGGIGFEILGRKQRKLEVITKEIVSMEMGTIENTFEKNM